MCCIYVNVSRSKSNQDFIDATMLVENILMEKLEF